MRLQQQRALTTSAKPFFKFDIIHQSKISKARVGVITTPHGIINTPAYVPVGTNGALKCLSHLQVDDMELMFANTYHLLLQPGPDVIRNAGGLHKFMNRNRPIITDSGGFQVFSLQHGSIVNERSSSSSSTSTTSTELKRASHGKNKNNGSVLKINEEGVLFRSYRDGKKIFLSPETSVDGKLNISNLCFDYIPSNISTLTRSNLHISLFHILFFSSFFYKAQKSFGADIIIPLDELPPHHIGESELLESLHRTHRWEKRSLVRHLENVNEQAMYGVIHGSTSLKFRTLSTDYISNLPFDGLAIGGSLGQNKNDLMKILQCVMPLLQEGEKNTQQRPVHLLGIGDESSIIDGIQLGVDSFDSALPTKIARHGTFLIREEKKNDRKRKNNIIGGRMSIRSSIFANDSRPIDEECTCMACRHHSRAYLHHLWRAKEPILFTLLSHHNLTYTLNLMKEQREGILAGRI